MCCVLFAWLAHQQYFKSKTDTDVRADLWDENREIIEDSIAPFGFFDVNSVFKEDVVSQTQFDNLDIHPGWYDPDDYIPDGERILPPSW